MIIKLKSQLTNLLINGIMTDVLRHIIKNNF